MLIEECLTCKLYILGEKSGDSKGSRSLAKVTFELSKKSSSTIEENSSESPKKKSSSENC